MSIMYIQILDILEKRKAAISSPQKFSTSAAEVDASVVLRRVAEGDASALLLLCSGAVSHTLRHLNYSSNNFLSKLDIC